MLSVLLVTAALACDQAVFNSIPAPEPDGNGHGIATGTASVDGKDVVGGNFTIYSPYPQEVWARVLADADSQDVWVPKKFGYNRSDRIDGDHMYMSFDLAFLFDSVHVNRQLVVRVQNDRKSGAARSCWWMVDPAPFMEKIAPWVSEAAWERAMFGRWTITPTADGRQLVSYQWWAEKGRVPAAVQRYAIGRTLPDLLDAFNERVRQLAGK